MDDYLKKDFGKILKANGLEARRWMKNTESTTSRVYDRNLDDLPVTVDLYGDYARVVDFSSEGLDDEIREEVIDLVSRFLYVERSRICFVYRKKREGREQHEKGEEECRVSVKENGLVFECELKTYTDTGLFLDQEETRKLVMEMALNQRVLNLFAYTSSFSVYAASGGAESVVSVDLSNVYSAWGRRNLDNNGFLDEKKYEVITEDARSFLERAVTENKVYDLVILDPPAFSNSHKAEKFDVQKDYMEFLLLIHKILSDGGVVVFSENLQSFGFEKSRLEGMFEIEEITNDVFAPNFSHKRKSMRVWVLKKSEKKRERKERRMSDELERLDVSFDEKETRVKRERKGAEAFSFNDSEEKSVKDSGAGRKNDKKKEYSSSRDRKDRRNNQYGKSSGYNDRRGDRDSYKSSRYDDRRDRYSDGEKRYSERNSRYSESDRKYSDRDSRYTDSNSRYSNRDSRYYDRDSRYGDRSSRYDDRKERYSDSSRRYSDRDSRYSDSDRKYSDRKSRYSDCDSRSYDSSSRYSSSYSRKDGGDRRNSYKRASYSSDRREQSNEGFKEERRKRTSPKPFGYDSFMENKNRAGATTKWLEEQEYMEKKED